MTFLQLLKTGGGILFLLMSCSVVSLGIIIERVMYYRRMSRMKREMLMMNVAQALKKRHIKDALDICMDVDTCISRVVAAGVHLYGNTVAIISNAMERAVTVEIIKLERLTTIVGTIGSMSVYAGLLGTVLGIMKAFHDISQSGFGGINIVINGIAEALITTVAGLCVAIPAVIAYNYFVKRIDSFIMDMELCASETLDLLTESK
ncbi:MAG TPA: MotA/TolQ/ExbB proton channel family protein [Candidatus Omnitrophota bacterium]|nr:MotA/TolQ/ExbB proton channel family protein [Candidatus Omnitrophota bacterium]